MKGFLNWYKYRVIFLLLPNGYKYYNLKFTKCFSLIFYNSNLHICHVIAIKSNQRFTICNFDRNEYFCEIMKKRVKISLIMVLAYLIVLASSLIPHSHPLTLHSCHGIESALEEACTDSHPVGECCHDTSPKTCEESSCSLSYKFFGKQMLTTTRSTNEQVSIAFPIAFVFVSLINEDLTSRLHTRQIASSVNAGPQKIKERLLSSSLSLRAPPSLA